VNGPVAYLDSSAYVKLFVAEPQSGALREELRRWERRVSCALLRTEVVRALRRSGDTHAVGSARRGFARLSLIDVDGSLLDRAADVGPARLRTLDAIHIAAAMVVGADRTSVFTYDDRLADAAGANGLRVLSPG
jgi:uncharacterized protein